MIFDWISYSMFRPYELSTTLYYYIHSGLKLEQIIVIRILRNKVQLKYCSLHPETFIAILFTKKENTLKIKLLNR